MKWSRLPSSDNFPKNNLRELNVFARGQIFFVNVREFLHLTLIPNHLFNRC